MKESLFAEEKALLHNLQPASDTLPAVISLVVKHSFREVDALSMTASFTHFCDQTERGSEVAASQPIQALSHRTEESSVVESMSQHDSVKSVI